MDRWLRKPMMAGMGMASLLSAACATTPAVEGPGYGGKLALEAVRAARAAAPGMATSPEYALHLAGIAPFDADHDGALSYDEWLERSIARHLFDDTDEDGRLSLQEHVAAGTRPRSPPKLEFLERQFGEMDQNGDGYVAVNDRSYDTAYSFRNLDKNRDGKVSAVEFGGPGSSRPVVMEPKAAVADLMGMTPNEIRDRFGLNRTDEVYADAARIENGGLVTMLSGPALSRSGGGCDANGQPALGAVRVGDWPQFVFRDGKLTGVALHNGLSGPVTEVVMRCNERVDAAGEVAAGTVLLVIAGAPLAPFMLPGLLNSAASGKPSRKDGVAALAALRLGEPPPGGLAAYAAAPPKAAKVQRSEDGSSAIVIQVDQTNFHATIRVRDGVIVALSAPYPCLLGQDRALHC